jgi:hypothetical protein
MGNILNFETFSLNEKRVVNKTKSNLNQIEYVTGGVKYKNEIFPGINIPKRYVGKGKHRWRVLARVGDRVKPVNFGDKQKKQIKIIDKFKRKYWEQQPAYM